MFFILIYIISILFALHLYLKYRRMGRYLNLIPGPPNFPIVGNIPKHFTRTRANYWNFYSKMAETYHPVCKLVALHMGGVVISDPENIEIFLSSYKHIKKGFMYEYMTGWLRNGLITNSGESWHTRRKLLTPAFHFNVLQNFVSIMSEQGQRMVDQINSHKKAVIIKLTPFLAKHTLRVICETALGTPFEDNDDKKFEEYRNAITEIGEAVLKRFLTFWNPFYLHNTVFNNFSQLGWRHKQVLKTLHDFSTDIINKRKEYHEQTNYQYLNDNEQKRDNATEHLKIKKKRMAMLDILISAQRRKEIDDLGIQEEVDTFIFAGHETISIALTFLIQLLAQHAEIQTQAREEINSVWDSCDGKIGIAELNQLSFLERCIKESLRLFPSVPVLSRDLNYDLQLKDYLIPAGSTVFVFVYDLHRNPRYWKDPLKFDPDRFLPENCVNRHPFTYIPFSAGPRNCIGQKNALMELKMLCAYVLRNFYLEAIERYEDCERELDLILKPQKDIHVKFIPIE